MTRGITRREFIRIGVVGAAAAVLTGCLPPRAWVVLEPYVRPPEEQLAGVATWYASTCRQCPAGCGIVVRIMNGRALKIEGNPEHPLNRGKLCARGQAGVQLLYHPDRLSGPAQQTQRGTRQFKSLSWNDALNLLYSKLQAAGSATAVWGDSTMSGHLADIFARYTKAISAPAPIFFDLYTLFNGYSVLSKTNQQLFGSSALPIYDLAHADVVFSFGADFLSAALSQTRYGVEYGAFRSQPLGKRGFLVQLEPRMTITGAKADRWHAIKPGAEGLIAQAIASIIADQKLGSVERQTRAQTVAARVDVNSVAAASGLSVDDLTNLARIFAAADHPIAIPGAALNGQNNVAQAASAVQALNIIAGNIAQPGGMGMSASAPAGLIKPTPSSFADAQALVEQMRAGRIQALLVHGANPAFDLPDKIGFADAVKNVPFVVSFAPIVDETARYADLILPDRTYLESWGYDVVAPSFGQPIVSGQQPVVTPVFDARATADVMLTVARGIPAAARALPYADEVAFLKETVAALGSGAAGGAGADVLWARFQQHGGWWQSTIPAATPLQSKITAPITVSSTQFQGDEKEYPYFLHLFLSDLLSDGRGAKLPWLQGSPDPMTTIAWQTWVEMHPETAQKLGITSAQVEVGFQRGTLISDVVQVTSPFGAIEAPVYAHPGIRPDTIAIPIGQGHTDDGRYARDRGANALRLVGAQADATGSSLLWAGVRVKIARTGRQISLATFEFTPGVTRGFINAAFPGQ